MARTTIPTAESSTFSILEDQQSNGERMRASTEELVLDDDEKGSGEETIGSDTSNSAEDDETGISPSVLDDIAKFQSSFQDIARQYRIIDRIGEGTFSTVYKAEDLLYGQHHNNWDPESPDSSSWVSPPVKKGNFQYQRRRPKYVALKKIYVTSSPMRIQNELELLYDLRHCKSICPLITAFRHQDQVVAVLPYCRHMDFREFFRHMNVGDMQTYIKSMFVALAAVHKEGILHRDIKPTNFLYDPRRSRGMLVDFGLAEREGTDWSYCVCSDTASRRRLKIENCYAAKNPPLPGYPKNDTRPARRANRAGTRGFRAPEVLLKCPSQTTKIDIWSAGVILLTMLSQRFPFFNSTDDIDAMIEIASIFGKRRMAACALLHGEIFECSIPSIGEKGFPFEKLILWSTCRTNERDLDFNAGELLAIRFLERCMELDPKKRISAKEALEHEFFTADLKQDEADEMDVV